MNRATGADPASRVAALKRKTPSGMTALRGDAVEDHVERVVAPSADHEAGTARVAGLASRPASGPASSGASDRAPSAADGGGRTDPEVAPGAVTSESRPCCCLPSSRCTATS